ncbi:uncharacterized protein LOC119847905 isoform X9 [Dermochelys coriacea]|uniref:uncharacterized protein LOC119847905 isoform X9 n=1 Tax=Dermochelys coriacea TaxID=27794 RepID=UPI001CA93807|nr:uncharacterized protein LOC119847905 isoform X9 [Dermochelys coriacea]
MALVLVPAFCLLSGAYAQEWSVKFTPGPLVGWTGSCVTIPCSFTYPAGWTVSAVIWIQDRDQTIYHRDEARVHARFKGRTRYLGDLQHNCSLRVAGLRPSDQGTYRFRFEVVGYGKSDGWWSKSEQQLMVSAPLCQPALRLRMEPGPSLTCSMGATCPHRPSWYNRDGAWRSPGQTSGRSGATELQISPSQLDAGVALRCQVDGYRDECDSDESQPLGTVTPPVRAPTYILGPSVALVLLLLVGLIGVIAWSKRQSKRQGLSSDPDQPGPEETPMSERIYENTQHYGMGKPARLAPPGPPSAPTEVCPGSPDGTGESHIYSQPMNIDRVLHVLSFPTGQRRSHPMRNSKDRPRIFTASWSLPKLVPTELCRNPDQPETPLHGRDLKHKEKPSLNGGRSQQGPQAPTFHCVGGCSSPGSVPDPTPTPSLPSRPHPCPAPPHLFPPPKYAASSLLSPVPRWAGGAGREGEALTGAAGECLTPRLGSSGHSSIGMNGARPPAGVMWPSLYWRT